MTSEDKGFMVIIAIIVGISLLMLGGAVGQTIQEARFERECLLHNTVEMNKTVFYCKADVFKHRREMT